MQSKRNLIANFLQCWSTWRALRRYPGLFSARDALQNWQAVLLPGRVAHQAAGRALAREARVESLPDGVSKVTLVGRDLIFYWLGRVDNNLHYVIDQEFNPGFPHNYTTPPVQLTPASLVLDVGACEGLFAFRVLKEKRAARVICFEPSAANVRYARLAAEANGLGNRITFEPVAVSKTSGRVRFLEEPAKPDSHSIQAGDGPGTSVECVSLDDYCAAHQLTLGRRDLIKVDAEGADLDVLLGAERSIRQGAPQLAVTTYHKEQHAAEMVEWLRRVQPAYRLRLKGFASWTPKPTPVLLQAAAG
jgi:FkbM family methyltransferase